MLIVVAGSVDKEKIFNSIKTLEEEEAAKEREAFEKPFSEPCPPLEEVVELDIDYPDGNDWMNEWMIEWMNEWMNQWMNLTFEKPFSEPCPSLEKIVELDLDCPVGNEWMNQWLNGKNEWMNE